MNRILAALAAASMLPSLAAARLPAVATMNGSFSGQAAGLTLDRRAWTVVGAIEGQGVNVTIDQDAKTIKGTTSGQTVALTFDWSPAKVSYSGSANGSGIEYSIDWQAGVLDGKANGSPVHIEFNVAAGTVDKDKSYANGWPVTLALDPPSGKLTGALGGRDVALTLVNADLSDFLQNLYLFLMP
jgi:hypothetical protein